MSTTGDPGSSREVPIGPHEDSRSGTDVNEAIEKAEANSQVEETHAASGASHEEDDRIEQIEDVEGATEGRRDGGEGEPTTAPDPGPSPADIGSGGAQRIEGGRISDRVAAGEPVPEGPPFEPPEDDAT